MNSPIVFGYGVEVIVNRRKGTGEGMVEERAIIRQWHELGVVVEVGNSMRFYPWTRVLSISRALPESPAGIDPDPRVDATIKDGVR